MRHPPSSRRSYREVLIAAGLTAALGVSTAQAEAGAASATQPHADGLTPNDQTSNGPADRAAVPRPAGADGMGRGSRR
jgi:hypothetical protein